LGAGGAVALTVLPDGNVGIGTTAPTSKLMVSQTLTETASATIMVNQTTATVTPATSSAANIYGMHNLISSTGSDITGSIIGTQSHARHTAASTLTTMRGTVSYARNTAAGTVTTAQALLGIVDNAG